MNAADKSLFTCTVTKGKSKQVETDKKTWTEFEQTVFLNCRRFMISIYIERQHSSAAYVVGLLSSV